MSHIAGEIRIGRPVSEVFDFVADSRNEPTYNPAMHDVELLTDEPLGAGARFRALMGRGGMEMLVTLTEYTRPHRLASTTTSSLMDTRGTLTFAPAGAAGTTMRWDWEVTPKGWLRLLGPLFGPVGSRMERRIWAGAKSALEGEQRA